MSFVLGTSETKVTSIAVTSSQGAGTSVAYSSRQSAILNKTKSLAHSLVSMNLSFSSNDSTTFVEKTSSVHISSSVVGLRSPKGSNSTFDLI